MNRDVAANAAFLVQVVEYRDQFGDDALNAALRHAAANGSRNGAKRTMSKRRGTGKGPTRRGKAGGRKHNHNKLEMGGRPCAYNGVRDRKSTSLNSSH